MTLSGLTICGHNCLLTAEWMSASKIVCRVGQAKNDKGDIIVTTKSGGKGTSTVSFKLLKPDKIGMVVLSIYFSSCKYCSVINFFCKKRKSSWDVQVGFLNKS